MTTTWKTALISYLKNRDAKGLRDQLKKIWSDLYPEDKETAYRFLLQARQYRTFIYLWVIDLQNQASDLPWILSLTLLEKHKIQISQETQKELEAICFPGEMYLSEENKSSTFLSRLIDLKRKNHQFNLNKKRNEILSSAEIAKSERLEHQYAEYMKELNKIYPNQYSTKKIISSIERNQAEKVLQKNSRKKKTAEYSPEKDQNTQEEKIWLQSIKNQAIEFLKNDKKLAGDFAFLMRSFGDNQSALEFIEQTEEGAQKNWQLLDYLSSGEQSLILLQHCEKLKKIYANKPDALFSILYAQSQAFWKLGEKEKATQVMEQISLMRPDFKSVDQILRTWKEDSFD